MAQPIHWLEYGEFIEGEQKVHVHEDNSLLLSALPADEFDRVMSEFEPSKN